MQLRLWTAKHPSTDADLRYVEAAWAKLRNRYARPPGDQDLSVTEVLIEDRNVTKVMVVVYPSTLACVSTGTSEGGVPRSTSGNLSSLSRGFLRTRAETAPVRTCSRTHGSFGSTWSM